jgi:hypothetical protein
MECHFFRAREVLNKDFKSWAMAKSKLIIDAAEEISWSQCGQGVDYISSINTRKEELAHVRQLERDVNEGLIGVWSCVESCNTFKSVFDPQRTYPALKSVQSRCKHLYFYFSHPVFGFMSVRLQTWAPWEVQVALNGREWLMRSLDKAGCGYLAHKNKLLQIDDYSLAQQFLDAQSKVDFGDILRGFLPLVFPGKEEVLGSALSYYWTFWQSEVARDYLFKDPDKLTGLMDDLQLHALMTGKANRILKYYASPVKLNGQPRKGADLSVVSKSKLWQDGLRVRHWINKNSLKFYNEQNVLRFEMTMNDPKQFKIYRHREGQCKDEQKKHLPMRKGVADTSARFDVSKAALDRFTGHIAAFKQTERLGELICFGASPIAHGAKHYRALDVFGKDRVLLEAIADNANDVSGITNKALQKALTRTLWAKNMTGKQLSARISRHLRLLREHGPIRKLPNQRKYVVTDKGRRLTGAIEAALSASVDNLLALAA